MLVGVPKEIKNQESRVGLTPASVKELTLRGHPVLVERIARGRELPAVPAQAGRSSR